MTPKSHDSRIALFAGSFRPWTVGHMSLLQRALQLFDRVVVMIGVNPDKPLADADETVAALTGLLASEPRVSVMKWSGLTVDAARSVGARFLLRGVRSVADFEYERNLADVNRAISGLETVILFTLPEHAMISSSVVRELQSHGADVTPFLP